MFRDFGPALQLFRIESERLKLPAPFSRRIAEPLDADAAGQATFYCQSAFKFDPVSASNFDPFGRRVLAVALAPSELVGVAETVRARAA
jgi:hypothetical protein